MQDVYRKQNVSSCEYHYKWLCIQHSQHAFVSKRGDKYHFNKKRNIRHICRKQWCCLALGLTVDGLKIPSSVKRNNSKNFSKIKMIRGRLIISSLGHFCYHWHNQWKRNVGDRSIIKQLINLLSSKLTQNAIQV